MANPAVSIVIGAYNEERTIGRCLASLARQRTRIPFEVIVVNNGSTDKTAAVAQTFQKQLYLRIIDESRRGRGRAKRRGFDAARGAIICSTDADTVLPPDWIELYVSAFQKQPDCAAISGLSFTRDFAPLSNIVINAGWILSRILFRFTMGYWYFAANNLAIRRTAYVKSGRFSVAENGAEDIALSHRVRSVGRILFSPRIRVTTSGRRFKGGILAGAWEYVRVIAWRFLTMKKQSELSDVR